MSDYFKATYDGRVISFGGWDGYVAMPPSYRTLTLQTDGHGTLTATTLTGLPGDTVTLTPTYNTYYRFNNYSVTGGTIAGNTFTFGNEDATVQANFKVNYFTATGGFEKGSNVTATRGSTNADTTTNIAAKYATHGAHTGDIPASWYSISNRWKPNNVSAYSITLNPKMNITTKYPSNGASTLYKTTITAVSLVGSTQSNSQSWSARARDNGNTTVNHYYNKTLTVTNQNVNYGLSAKIFIHNIATYPVTAIYVANATTGTWTATGIAP